jgi:hypothetical protein
MLNYNYKEISKQVEDVIRYSQGLYDYSMNIDPLMQKWKKNKRDFINILNGNLIWEYPDTINFHLSEEARRQKLESFIYDVEVRYDSLRVGTFLRAISDEEFFNNKTNEKYTINNIIIPSGMKVVKAFKLLEPNEKLLEDMQNEASRIIQEDIISGKLCVSVHPLDYLSISENNHNWRSCHALDGDYRSGNLNYMVDNCTVVCYLRSEEPSILPHFPNDLLWNSKKWRVLLYFSQDKNMVFLSRQYPFSSDIGIEYIQKLILPKITSCPYWTEFQPNYCEDTLIPAKPYDFIVRNGIRIGNSLVARKEWIQDGYNTHHFNDVTNSSFYTEPLYSYAYGVNNTSPLTTTFKIGEAAPCPVCGAHSVRYEDRMLCGNCLSPYPEEDEIEDGYCECANCGDSYAVDDMIWLPESGSYVCSYCFNNAANIVRCEECNIKDFSEYVYFDRGKEKYLCRACANGTPRPRIENILF